MRKSRVLFCGCAAAVLAACAGGAAHAKIEETRLHAFSKPTGETPMTGLVRDASTGAFYGTTWQGGANGHGVIYQLLPPTPPATKGATYSVIYNSIYYHTNLAVANGVVYVSGDNSGGACNSGDGIDCGAIFSLAPAAGGADWIETRLYTFGFGADGEEPEGPLAMDGQGALYGTAFNGGTHCAKLQGCGTVFKLSPPSVSGHPWTYSVVYHFQGGKGGQQPANGVIFDNAGNLYGSAPFDYPSGNSLIFKLTPPLGAGDWTESVLDRFYPNSSCYSGGPLAYSSGPLAIDANGALYGVFSAYASQEYSSCTDTASEYAFQLAPSQSDPNVWVKTIMHTYTSGSEPDGFKLTAPLTVDGSGNVYGATLAGGIGAGADFVLKPRPGVPGKWNFTSLYKFGGTNLSGGAPNGGLALTPDGAIYGTTQYAGGGGGVIYRLTK